MQPSTEFAFKSGQQGCRVLKGERSFPTPTVTRSILHSLYHMRKCKAVKRAVRVGSGHCKRHFPILVTTTNVLPIINCSLYMKEGTGVFLKTLQYYFIFPYDGVIFPFEVITL